MSTESVRSAILGCVDRLAAWRAACQSAVAAGAGTLLWAKVDASADVLYENRVKGTDIADVDSKMTVMDVGSIIQKFFGSHASYFSSDLGISGGWSTFLAQQKFRVPEEFGDLYYNAYSQRISAPFVFPKQSRSLATWTRTGGADVISPTAGITSTTYGPTRIGAVISAVASPGLAIVNVVAMNYLGSPVTMRTALSGADIGSEVAVGQQAVVSDVAVADLNIGVNSTGHFTVGDRALMVEGAKTEVLTIASISANAYIRASSPMVNSFTSSGYLEPLFYKIGSIATVSGTTNTDSLLFRPRLDRTLGW